ncbi:MAG: response regulator [Pseudolabrys sp.]|nr:response regulator [Pseudolabrys sp.]
MLTAAVTSLTRRIMHNKPLREMIQGLAILIVDDNAFMRRQTRTMLTNLGAKSVYEAADGLSALETIRIQDPDIMVLDWDMPVLNGPEVMRIVRSPELFPRPNLPIIMLSERARRSDVLQALRLGAHEFLIKPTSPKALQDRLVSIMVKPRQMMQIGKYYVPKPRNPALVPPQALLAAAQAEAAADIAAAAPAA